MTEHPHPLFNHPAAVVASDAAHEADFTSPAISISSSSNGRYETTNQGIGYSDASGAKSAYATRPSSEAGLGTFLRPPSSSPAIVVHDTQSLQYLVQNPSHVGEFANSGPAFATFGSHTWAAPPRPFLDFAPQPAYEPGGELADEPSQTFEQFDSPSSIRSSTGQSHSSGTARPAPSPRPQTTTDNSASGTVFAQPSLPKSALKRKAEHDITSPNDSRTSRGQQAVEPGSGKRRSVSFERMSAPNQQSPGDVSPSSHPSAGQRVSQSNPSTGAARARARQSTSSSTPRPSVAVPPTGGPAQGRQARGSRVPSATPPSILPPEKVFPIQIGSELFRLSGASISSDAPSYFTQVFEERLRQNEDSGNVGTLIIDRDPITFRDVARHLQGYHIRPTDGSHFVKLFADAQFYSLPRLIDQLFESEIFIQIGERHFQIPKDIFSDPGNSPNFFSLGFAVFFSTPSEVFPGLDRRGLLRPPSISPPSVPGRSSEIFAEILHLLRGYPVHIRNEEHRTELVRDCRYFHLRGLEQKVIAHDISYNLERQKSEICIRLEDVKPSGVSYLNDDSSSETANLGWVYYARPFVDDTSYELIIEIGGETTIVDLNEMRADFHGLTKARVSSLFQVVANKMNLPTNAPLGLMMLSGGRSSQSASPGHTPLSEDKVKIRLDQSTDITLNGHPYEVDWDSPLGQNMLQGPSSAEQSSPDSDAMSEVSSRQAPRSATALAGMSQSRSALAVPPLQTAGLPTAKKRKLGDSDETFIDWTIRRGQWRLRVQPNPQDTIRGGLEIVFVAVKIDALTTERARNIRRRFLG